MAKKSKKSNQVSVDFTGVSAGGRTIADNQYILTVNEVPTLETSPESGNQYIKWCFSVAEGKYKGRKLWHNTSLQPQALFNLRNLLEAMEVEVEEGDMDIDLDDFEGVSVGAIVVNEKYEGKDRPRVSEFIRAEDVEASDEDEDEDEEETPKPKSKSKAPAKPAAKGKKAKDEDEDEDEDETPKSKSKSKTRKVPSFSVGDRVSFVDEDGDEMTGKITALDEDEDTATVKVGKTVFELDLDELVAS